MSVFNEMLLKELLYLRHSRQFSSFHGWHDEDLWLHIVSKIQKRCGFEPKLVDLLKAVITYDYEYRNDRLDYGDELNDCISSVFGPSTDMGRLTVQGLEGLLDKYTGSMFTATGTQISAQTSAQTSAQINFGPQPLTMYAAPPIISGDNINPHPQSVVTVKKRKTRKKMKPKERSAESVYEGNGLQLTSMYKNIYHTLFFLFVDRSLSYLLRIFCRYF